MLTRHPRREPNLDSTLLTDAAEWCWYIVAAVSYITAGIWNKWLLNWLVGPVWLVAVVCLGPPLATWVRGELVGRLIGGRR